MSPCGSYTHGETVFEEFTTVDQCTRTDSRTLCTCYHLRESTELKSESDLILMRAGKSIFIITLFEKGGGSTLHSWHTFVGHRFCQVPHEIAGHKKGRAKGDRAVSAEFARQIFLQTSSVVSVGSSKVPPFLFTLLKTIGPNKR